MPETRPAAAVRPELSFLVETINLRGEGEFGPLDVALEHLQQQTLPPDRYEKCRHRFSASAGPERARGTCVPAGPRAPGAWVLLLRTKNAGARPARGDIVGFVDADCEPVATRGETVVGLFATRDATLGAVQGT